MSLSTYIPVEQIGVSDLMYEESELIDCYESAKLPVYIPKRKVEAQPLIRCIRSGSPGAERKLKV
jgi:hypothetical protein